MAKYTEVFKRKAVALLSELNEKGTIVIDSIEIKNVRELVKFLNVSNYSLYGWNKLYGEADEFVDNIKNVKIDFFDDKEVEKFSAPGEKSDIFGIRYYAWFARNLGVKNYYNMVLAQLKLAIGNELIKQSGLVDVNKASKKLKQNGDNL